MNGGILRCDFQRTLVIKKCFGVVFQDEEFFAFRKIKLGFALLDARSLRFILRFLV
jgi:hypothetical protein